METATPSAATGGTAQPTQQEQIDTKVGLLVQLPYDDQDPRRTIERINLELPRRLEPTGASVVIPKSHLDAGHVDELRQLEHMGPDPTLRKLARKSQTAVQSAPVPIRQMPNPCVPFDYAQ